MQSIGDRLEEARKRQNLTLREASDATKVRVDFLTAYEKNEFVFDLPEIYRRGFLKIYASFLKLDVKKVMLDYSALTASAASGRAARQSHLARMDLDPAENATSQNKPSFRPTASGLKRGDEHAENSATASGKQTPMPKLPGSVDSGTLWKFGLVIVGGLLGMGILILFVNQWTQVDPDDIDRPVSTTMTSTETGEDNAASAPQEAQQFTLIAAGGDVFVRVTAVGSGAVLHNGTIADGGSADISSNGAARSLYSEPNFFRVIKNGQTFRAADGSHQMRTDQF